MNKNVKVFLIVSLVMILISGVYFWLLRKDNVDALSYVPDGGWSEWHVISPAHNTEYQSYDIDAAGNIHMVWVDYTSEGMGQLTYSVANGDGKVVQPPKVLKKSLHMFNVSAVLADDSMHIFGFNTMEKSRRRTEKLDLYYMQIDFQGEILKEKILLSKALSEPNYLKTVISPEKEFLLVWTDFIKDQFQVQTLVVDTVGNTTGVVHNIIESEYDASNPNVLPDPDSGYHLTWKEGYGTSNVFYYQFLDSNGIGVDQPRKIDSSAYHAIAMGLNGDQLYLAWNKRMARVTRFDYYSTIEQAWKTNYDMFVTVLDTKNPEADLTFHRVTAKNGPSFNQTLAVDDEGQVHIAYVEGYFDRLALTHKIYNADLTEEVKPRRRIYTEQRGGYNPKLISLPDRGMYLLWKETIGDRESQLYYANDIEKRGNSPLQIIGINSEEQGTHIIMSLGYILGFPIFQIFILFHWIVVLFIVALVVFGSQQLSKWGLKDKVYNIFLQVGVSCGLFYLWFVITQSTDRILWPEPIAPFFTYGLATIGLIAFLWFGKIKLFSKIKTLHILSLSLTVLIWIYWLNVINLVFNLPNVNF